MPIVTPVTANYLYQFTAGSATYRLTDIAASQTVDGEDYESSWQIKHTAPTFSQRGEDAEVDITIHEAHELSELFVNGPAPYPVKLTIYEYDRETEVATPYYRGWVVRVPFRLTDSLMVLRCKSVWHYFDRDSLVDSLSALSRYSVYDPRAGVDLDALRVPITVTAINDERDELTVTGITEIDGWFSGGMIVAPDNDKRTILDHTGAVLKLNGGFPVFTLAVGFSADIYPGDDLRYSTWANKFQSETNNGEAWGGWNFMPSVDPAIRGVI